MKRSKNKPAVGDPDSDEKGSGARYNSDKDPLEYIPMRQFCAVVIGDWGDLWQEERNRAILSSLGDLTRFQEGQDNYIHNALCHMRDHIGEASRVLQKVTQEKYPAWNWAKGMPWSVCFGCAMRHARAFLEGKEIDEESGLSHLAHYTCNLIFLSHYVRHYPEGDDRPKVFYGNYKSVSSGQGFTKKRSFK